MKKTSITLFFAAAVFLSCSAQKSSSSSTYSDDNGCHSIIINDENGSFELKYSGDISFTEDEAAVKSIAPGGYIKYRHNGSKITVTAGNNGNIFYEVNGGAKKVTLSSDEASLLSRAIQTMISYGVGAKDRVQKIYKQGGSAAVLGEVKKMKSDYVKSMYLDFLLQTNDLSPAEMTTIAGNISTLIDSDFEKGKLLNKFSGKYLADATIVQAFLNAVKTIDSDFEKANAVKKILERPLTPGQFTAVLQVVNSIESDFEKANVLKKVLQGNSISTAQFSEVLRSAAAIGSDFEKANILKDLLRNNQLPEPQFNETLGMISSISSDFEKANVLRKVAAKNMTEAQWINLIGNAEKIDADFEKSNLLNDIAAKMPASSNVKAAFMKAAKTISSDHEYGRLMRAVK